jgi:hypothetical protein
MASAIDSKCPDASKVRNPLTDKCILIRGKVCQHLLKQTSIRFDKADVKKIRNAGYHVEQQIAAPIQITQQQQSIPELAQLHIDPEDTILTKIKKYIQKYIQSGIIDKPGIVYIDQGHKKFCQAKKNSISNLTSPIEKYSLTYTIPIDFAVITKKDIHTFTKHLSDSNIPFERKLSNIFNIDFNNYNQHDALGIFHKDFEVSSKWIASTNKYITHLSTKDQYTILGYSYHSFDFINAYLRGSMNKAKLMNLLSQHKTNTQYFFPFFIQVCDCLPELDLSAIPLNLLQKQFTIHGKTHTLQFWVNVVKDKKDMKHAYPILLQIQQNFPYEFWLRVMKKYASDLERIINASPVLTEPLILYRGVKDDYFLKGKSKNYYKSNTFLSCSLNPYHSIKYVPNQCCLKRISILPGAKALLIAGLSHYNEYEVILNKDTVFYIHQKKRYSIYQNKSDALSDLCFHTNQYPKRQIDIVDIIISPNK